MDIRSRDQITGKLFLVKTYKAFLLKLIMILLLPVLVIKSGRRGFLNKKIKAGILNIEYFHKEVGVFGGYGKTAKNLSDHFNSIDNSFNVEILLNRPMSFGHPKIKDIDNTPVIFFSDLVVPRIRNFLKYAWMVNRRNIDILLTIEFYSAYFYTLFLLPRTPLVIWIHDPRPEDELKKIRTVELAKLTEKAEDENALKYERLSFKRIIRLSRFLKRDVFFAMTAKSLVNKAMSSYRVAGIKPVFLPIPVKDAPIDQITFSPRPTACYLGRLDPVKRPVIFFELAKRRKDIDFIVAGKTHFPQLMDKVIEEYSKLPNLKFLGMVHKEEKAALLKDAWCVINTSIHEALPVSFLEALSYGKPIISCHDPDNIVSRFGVFTGEILGEGTDEGSINAFDKALNKVLTDRQGWLEKGALAREFIRENYSFKKFEDILLNLYKTRKSVSDEPVYQHGSDQLVLGK